jgi:hypothetical protein
MRSKRLRLWGVLLGSSLLIAELSLRLVGFGNPLLFVMDPDIGYYPAASQTIRRFGARTVINSYSMRSDALKVNKDKNMLRILTLGDSVVFGTTFVDQSDIFTSLLNRELTQTFHRPVEVFNISAGGWAPANEAAYIQRNGIFESDVVLLVVNSGDLPQPFSASPVGDPSFPISKPPCALCELWSRYLAPKLEGLSTKDPGSTGATLVSSRKEMSQVFIDIERAHSVAQRAGASFVIVFSPGLGSKWDTPEHRETENALDAWTHSKCIPLINMRAVYSTKSPDSVVLDGIHLTVLGHRLFAEHIKQQLPQWLARSKAPCGSKTSAPAPPPERVAAFESEVHPMCAAG